jgi:TolA-binding protein
MHYDAVPPAHEKQVAAAKQALPAAKDPAEKARLEALVKGPPPDFVTEAIFHSAVLLYEQKAFPEALVRFGLVLQREKRAPWIEETRLRAGMCQVRIGQPAEAVKTLQPLQDHARLARVARWWTAQAILATPGAKPADAAEHLKKAAAAPDAESGPSKDEVLLALGGALEKAGQPAEAAGLYAQLLAGPRAEEALARLPGAHAAAKQYREADETAIRFEKQHPTSSFLGEVLLGRADAAFAQAQAASGDAARALFAEALKRYERVLVGTGPTANAARYRTAIAHYRLGRFAEAAASLRAIPEGERTGELAGAFALQAECLLRSARPAEEAADAIAAAEILKDLQDAAGQLQKHLPNAGGQAPEVTLKLGQVLQQVAALLSVPQERAAVANDARALYENFRNAHPNHPLRPVAEYERANCLALAGDPAQAIQKLERFKADPFQRAPVAPLALLRQGQLYRQINQAAQAAAVLADCRARHEAALLKDAGRAGWVPLLRYHHAAALKAANQGAQAAPVLESVIKDFASSEWAEPARKMLKEVKP